MDDTSTKIDADGGSSSVLSSALCAGVINASASSMITTRRRPSNGRYSARSITSRTCSILIEPMSPGSMRITSGCTPRWMRRQAGHSPHESRDEIAGFLRLETVQRFGNGHRHAALADARRAGQEQRGRQGLTRDRS